MGSLLQVLRTPNRTYETLDSKAAGITQLLYELQYENYRFNAYQSNGGFYEFGITSADHAEMLVGNEYAFRSYDGTLQVIGTVTSINGSLKTIDVEYTGGNIFIDGGVKQTEDTGSPSPYYDSYRIVVRLEDLNKLDYIFTPDVYGYLYMNLGRTIEPILISRSETYNYLNISYQEYYTGGSNTKQFFEKTLATLAERQLQSLLGSNLWEMMLKVANLPNYDVGKLLTKFESKETKRWIGWKRTISCIVDPDIAVRFPVNAIEWYFRDADRNEGPIGSISTPGIAKSPYRIEERELPADQGGYYTEVFIRDDTTLDRISETFFFVNTPECENPVMLEWLNEDGAVEQWLFDINQVILDTVEQGLKYTRPITQDIETVQRTKFRQVDRWLQRMTLQADHLTADQVDALHDIKRSDFVRVFLTKDGSEFIGVVVVDDFDDIIRTRATLHSFNVTIEFPDNFDFYNAKKY